MPALDLEGKVCPRHPKAAAIARCFSCFKPICGECLIIANGHDFCSQKCAESHAKTSKTFDEFEAADRRARRRRRIRMMLRTIVFLVLVYGAVSFWVRNPETVEGWIAAISGSIVGIVDSVKEMIQGLTG